MSEWKRVRDAAVAPVEDDVAAVAHEDLPVVEVVVLDRFVEAVFGEGRAHLLEMGDGFVGAPPPAVGTRSTVDHQRTCGCSISTVTSTRARIHAVASASHSGRLQPSSRDLDNAREHRKLEKPP